MEHSYFKDRISAFCDNELKHEERQLIAEHVQDCGECQKLLEELQKFDRMVKRHSELADDEYWEKSAQKIESAVGSERPVEIVDVKRSPIKGLGWKLAAAAASIALLTSIAMHQTDLADWIGKDTQVELRVIRKAESLQPDQVVDEEPATQMDERRDEAYAPAPAAPEKAEDRGVVGIEMAQDTSLRQAAAEYRPGKEIRPRVGVPKPVADEPVTDAREADYLPMEEMVSETLNLGYEALDVREAESYAEEGTLSKAVPEVPSEHDSDLELRPPLKGVDDHPGTGIMEDRIQQDAESAGEIAPADTVRVDTQLILEQWRYTRDSLETIVTALPKVETSDSTREKKAAVAAYDRVVMQAIVDSVSPEVAEHDPQLKLLEAHYQVARWTGRGSEYERSVKYLKNYLEWEDAPFKLHAAWYLQQLERAD
jgi:hypothetical protein